MQQLQLTRMDNPPPPLLLPPHPQPNLSTQPPPQNRNPNRHTTKDPKDPFYLKKNP